MVMIGDDDDEPQAETPKGGGCGRSACKKWTALHSSRCRDGDVVGRKNPLLWFLFYFVDLFYCAFCFFFLCFSVLLRCQIVFWLFFV